MILFLMPENGIVNPGYNNMTIGKSLRSKVVRELTPRQSAVGVQGQTGWWSGGHSRERALGRGLESADNQMHTLTILISGDESPESWGIREKCGVGGGGAPGQTHIRP